MPEDQASPKLRAPQQVDGDKPIVNVAEDRLGFGEIANHLAQAFLQNDLSTGFVVGVEGEWGSGKSSLVGMALAKLRESKSINVVDFQPWLVGYRDELLRELFSQLAIAMDPIGKNKSTVETLRKFSQYASGLGVLAEAIGKTGSISGSFVGKLLKNISKAVEPQTPPLAKIKQDLKFQLLEMDVPIVVFIDDLDRLDPSEAVEVLRLVRAVADFPNIAYILAYDADVLARNLQTALGIIDGYAYIEKIVQASFRVPTPLDYDLTHWFSEEVLRILPATPKMSPAEERLDTALHVWPRLFLKTPRDVVRSLNALRLYAVPVADRIDAGDMVFLQLVRLKKPELHKWIEDYVMALAGLGDWRISEKSEGRDFSERLKDIFTPYDRVATETAENIRNHLPGISFHYGKESADELTALKDLSREELESFGTERRLASPSHFRLYFGFSEPTGAFTDKQVIEFIDSATKNTAAAGEKFKNLCRQQRPQGGTFGAMLLDRLSHVQTLPAESAEPVLFALSYGMEEFYKTGSGTKGLSKYLAAEKNVPFHIFQFVPNNQKITFLKSFFASGPSLMWLTGIMRSALEQIYNAARLAAPDDQGFFNTEQIKEIKVAFVDRIKATLPNELRMQPRLRLLLYCWSDAGDPEGVKRWVSEQTEDDTDFVSLLEDLNGIGPNWSTEFGQVNKRDLVLFLLTPMLSLTVLMTWPRDQMHSQPARSACSTPLQQKPSDNHRTTPCPTTTPTCPCTAPRC